MLYLGIFLLTITVIIPITLYTIIRVYELYQDQHPPKYLAPKPPKKSYEFLKLRRGPKIKSKKWFKKMGTIGLSLKSAKVKHILFVHGSFVGNDPYDIIRLLEELIPFIPPSVKKDIGDWFRKKIKNLTTFIMGDVGNFNKDYIFTLNKVFPKGIDIHNFTWSSGNHHMARIRGTLKLTNTFVNLGIKNKDRILLIGHSHGGQLFSLLTLLLGDKALRQTILSLLPDPEDAFSYQQKFERLENVKFDFVTMGTPPRYEWDLTSNKRLLNFINHRGKTPMAGRMSGFLFTRDGDYVQQYGIDGSDAYSTLGPDRKKNKDLENILGTGHSIPRWVTEIRKRKRVPDFGFSLLINYKDASILPNFIRTLQGHGVYTRKRMMVFTFNQINKKLYS
jgi:hypothetical protein